MYETTPSLAGSLRRKPFASEDPWVGLLDNATYDARRIVREQMKWDRVIDTASATWLGFLVNLVEAGKPVAIHTEGNQTVCGRIIRVGVDFVGVATTNEFIAIASTAIVHVESKNPIGLPDGERSGSTETLHSLLQRATEDRCDVGFTLRGKPDELFGQLRTCGADLCALASTEGSQRFVYVPISGIVSVRMAKK